jgi:hypothetical protein
MKRQRGSLLFGYFFLAKQDKVSRMSHESDGFDLNSKWIPAFAPQGYSDLLSAKALAKSYAGMTGVED